MDVGPQPTEFHAQVHRRILIKLVKRTSGKTNKCYTNKLPMFALTSPIRYNSTFIALVLIYFIVRLARCPTCINRQRLHFCKT